MYIPNGDKVPSPCPAGGAWPGVGHQVPAGGGDRNPFGLHFAANNHVSNQRRFVKNFPRACRLKPIRCSVIIISWN